MMKTDSLLSTNHLFMVDPVGFGFNFETAESNAFQQAPSFQEIHEIELLARKEFDSYANLLTKNGMTVHTLIGQNGLPDAVFPNNLFSTHADGTWIQYPMMALNRQSERQLQPAEFLMKKGFEISSTLDLTHWETQNAFLEGTGSLILHPHEKTAWMAISPRAHLNVAQEWSEKTGYQLHSFCTHDQSGKPVYHTNVIMAVGSHWHFICEEMIISYSSIEDSLTKLNSQPISISMEQVYQFCGNVLEVKNEQGTPFGVISKTAWNSLHHHQKRAWEKSVQPLIVDISTIERIGGGSARCMLAEIFLPYKHSMSMTT